MKSKITHFLLTIILCGFSHLTVFSQSAGQQPQQLMVGDDAPGLKIDQWVKGGNFTPLEKGKVYLFDLWATWCVPCIAGMPYLSELQAKYKAKGLEIIGITSEDKYGTTLENVKKFVLKKDTLMNYNVAWLPVSGNDSLHGIWLHPWMIKSGLGNLPTAFLVDRNGKIVYIGDPLTIDETLEAVMNDHYNMNVLKSNYVAGINAEKTLDRFNISIDSNKMERVMKYGKQILNDYSYVKPNTYLVMGWQIAHIKGDISPELLQMGYDAAMRGTRLTRFASPAFLDVLAAIYAEKKDYVSAVIYEKLAVSMSEGKMREGQEKSLGKYLSLALTNQ